MAQEKHGLARDVVTAAITNNTETNNTATNKVKNEGVVIDYDEETKLKCGELDNPEEKMDALPIPNWPALEKQVVRRLSYNHYSLSLGASPVSLYLPGVYRVSTHLSEILLATTGGSISISGSLGHRRAVSRIHAAGPASDSGNFAPYLSSKTQVVH